MTPTRKLSISVHEPVAAGAREIADRDYGGNLSAFVGDLVEREMRRRLGLDAVNEWEAHHGAITRAEQAEARALWRA